jgi:hypothetical protein
MAKTINEGFDIFLSWLTPTNTESDNAKSHRKSIEACLKANFDVRRFFRTGSFGNGTSISSYSDVDYFASIPREKLKQNSNVTLNNINDVLNKRFPNTGVHIDYPAVVIPFSDDPAETTEIVPADFLSRKSECSIYDIPNCNADWMRASPESHKLYIDERNEYLNNKVKPLIRFIKAWKYYHAVPISSFYLEMFVGMYAATQSSILYSIDINTIFKKLQSSQISGINDPMGVSGTIFPCENSEDTESALEKISEALERSNHARKAETENRIGDAFYWWGKVYNGGFPSY